LLHVATGAKAVMRAEERAEHGDHPIVRLRCTE
jgi:hypothetical protein